MSKRSLEDSDSAEHAAKKPRVDESQLPIPQSAPELGKYLKDAEMKEMSIGDERVVGFVIYRDKLTQNLHEQCSSARSDANKSAQRAAIAEANVEKMKEAVSAATAQVAALRKKLNEFDEMRRELEWFRVAVAWERDAKCTLCNGARVSTLDLPVPAPHSRIPLCRSCTAKMSSGVQQLWPKI